MKEKKQTTKPSRDPQVSRFSRANNFNNRLVIPQPLMDKLTKDDLDWRFINANQFRMNGNSHNFEWTPYKPENPAELGVMGVNAEGLIQRGDLLLAVRPKSTTREHRQFLKEQRDIYKGYNRQKAKEMRDLFREHGVSEDASVHEGYEDND
jgi:hypothetical protein